MAHGKGLDPNKYVNHSRFYWSDCSKPKKLMVMYLCVKGINFGTIATVW